MKRGKDLPHDKPWEEMTEEELTHHFIQHANGYYWREGGEDHLVNMICRGMMLLEKREG